MHKSRMGRFLVYRAPLLLYMSYIFYMSSGPVEAAAFSYFPDYLMHAAGYSLFYALAHWAFHEGLPAVAGRGGYWLAWLATVLYGTTDELHQSFVPSRQCSASDLLADAAGGLIGALCILLIVRLRRRGNLVHRPPAAI